MSVNCSGPTGLASGRALSLLLATALSLPPAYGDNAAEESRLSCLPEDSPGVNLLLETHYRLLPAMPNRQPEDRPASMPFIVEAETYEGPSHRLVTGSDGRCGLKLPAGPYRLFHADPGPSGSFAGLPAHPVHRVTLGHQRQTLTIVRTQALP
ncbi:MAG: hypothetical protein AAGI11_15825 [Pseudomonadota bacterium]